MSEPSTTASTWAPDWEALTAFRPTITIMDGRYHADLGYMQAVIAEYQRQAAAAGLVMVRREDVEIVINEREYMDAWELAARNLDAQLAATTEPAPGGDG